MILIECPACGRRELRGTRSIERFQHTTMGIIATIRCTSCGHHCQLRTGRASEETVAHAC